MIYEQWLEFTDTEGNSGATRYNFTLSDGRACAIQIEWEVYPRQYMRASILVERLNGWGLEEVKHINQHWSSDKMTDNLEEEGNAYARRLMIKSAWTRAGALNINGAEEITSKLKKLSTLEIHGVKRRNQKR